MAIRRLEIEKNLGNVKKIRKVLLNQTKKSFLNLCRQQNSRNNILNLLCVLVAAQRCKLYFKHAQLLRKPNISLSPPTSPNIAKILDIIALQRKNLNENILVMLKAGDLMLRFHHLSDDSARTEMNAYCSRLLAIFDAPNSEIKACSTNIINESLETNPLSFQ